MVLQDYKWLLEISNQNVVRRDKKSNGDWDKFVSWFYPRVLLS